MRKTGIIHALLGFFFFMGSCSTSFRTDPNVVALQKEGPFIAFSNGTVLDTKNRLMWSSIDFRRDINWLYAESFCTSFSVGGYHDWRLPTLNELQALYDARKTDRDGYHTTNLIRISGYIWASDLRILMNTLQDSRTVCEDTQLAGYMDFKTGRQDFADARQTVPGIRILPVRNLE